jgi:hypothetical protein
MYVYTVSTLCLELDRCLYALTTSTIPVYLSIWPRKWTLVRLNDEKALFSAAYWTLASAIIQIKTNHVGVRVYSFSFPTHIYLYSKLKVVPQGEKSDV